MSYNATHYYNYESQPLGFVNLDVDSGAITTALTSGTYNYVDTFYALPGVYAVSMYYELTATSNGTFNSMIFQPSGSSTYLPVIMIAVLGTNISDGQVIPASLNTTFSVNTANTIQLGVQSNFATGTYNNTRYKVQVFKIA